ncbi:Stp1/IreP family PP2C-type Ser/Thr phosphatase [Halobacillus litoralis]|uniref:protein-serine/threonine phosphatase n=1 Tax=Halobacillus litoralis TaxID=45668 RepID=A0A845FAW1_9BACI|nr:Stp1/IreP family PP2C-type Ser/Thr phosphatase [Halobacillus litoralis]MYL70914.1 Stp1/IreP family PP2C-type Ser/Thr phosphatase [Halobacillus litoralis]
MIGYYETDQGKVRIHNEDAGGVFKNDAGQVLAIVADGMGGHQAGDVASQMTTSHIHKKWQEAHLIETPDEAEKWIKEAVRSANNEIKSYANEHEECAGMGTTVVVALCTGEFATIGHIGDSRCYFANDYGFKVITEDHSLVNELVRSGQITEEQAEHHPRKNVLLKALGTEFDLTADVKTMEFEENDRLLLCTDGLTNKVTDEELSELKTFEGNWSSFTQQMIDLANERGGEDNITLAVIHHHPSSDVKEGAE